MEQSLAVGGQIARGAYGQLVNCALLEEAKPILAETFHAGQLPRPYCTGAGKKVPSTV